MNEPYPRITKQGSNVRLHISSLIEILVFLQGQHGDLPCAIYSSDTSRLVPLLPLSLSVGRVLSFSAPTGSVIDEALFDLARDGQP
jgi:hypothetical protein